MNRKLFSEIRKSCKTKSQRLAFNRLVKSFADYEPLDIPEYLERRFKNPNSIYEYLEKGINENGVYRPYKECTRFDSKQIESFIDFKDNNIIVSLGDLKGVVSIYVSYKDVPGSTNGAPSRYVNRVRMEVQLNKLLPEEFITWLKSNFYISSYKGKRNPKLIDSSIPNTDGAMRHGVRLIKWAYDYLISNNMLD